MRSCMGDMFCRRAAAVIPGQSPGTAPGTAGTAVAQGSWWGLLTTMQLARDPAFTRRGENIACPNDGTLYRTGPNGELYCPFDGFRPRVGMMT